MDILTFERAVKLHTQDGLAELLGVTQGAVWQATGTNRNIFIMKSNDGSYAAFEIKAAFRTQPNIDEIISLIINEPQQLEEA